MEGIHLKEETTAQCSLLPAAVAAASSARSRSFSCRSRSSSRWWCLWSSSITCWWDDSISARLRSQASCRARERSGKGPGGQEEGLGPGQAPVWADVCLCKPHPCPGPLSEKRDHCSARSFPSESEVALLSLTGAHILQTFILHFLNRRGRSPLGQELGIMHLTLQSRPSTRLHCLAGKDQQRELHLSICLLNEAASPGISEN